MYKRLQFYSHSHTNRVSSMSCGMAHTGVVTDTGTVLMFGKAKYGRLGLNDEVDRPMCVNLPLFTLFYFILSYFINLYD